MLALSANAQAFELGSGGGFITQGDDRLSPSLHAWIQAGKFRLAGSLMGEKNSSFAHQLSLTQLSYSTPLGKLKRFEGSLGLGAVLSRTRLPENTATEKKENFSVSGGLTLGLHWRPQLMRDLRFRLDWDSVFVPPGISVMYLTYGHLQSLSTGLAWEI